MHDDRDARDAEGLASLGLTYECIRSMWKCDILQQALHMTLAMHIGCGK